jgi:hypothetical protein
MPRRELVFRGLARRARQRTNKTGLDSNTAIVPKRVKSPVKVYTRNIGRGGRNRGVVWEVPEWDLAETGRIIDTEALVRQICNKKKNLFLKEGYEFTGKNPDTVRYIEARLKQMEFATEIPFPVLLSNTAASLVRQHNAFWVKVRKTESSGGRRRKDHNGKDLDPVAGYFPLPAETISFKRDEYGKVVKYRQVIYGKEPKEFNPEDVIHFYWDRRDGFSVGTPDLVPVKDDIRALRRIEETVELLAYQHLFPLFHYKVGTEDAPAAVYSDGKTEVEIVQEAVADMPSDGCWVTPERHSIEVVGVEGKALAAEKIIEHFKARVYAGMGVSPVDMGEPGGASRSAAHTVSRNLVDNTKAYQKEFGAQFYSYVIQELLLESTFGEKFVLDKANKVVLKFSEIDFEARMAKSNHSVDLWAKNALSHDEMRQDIGREVMEPEDWEGTYWKLIDEQKIILQSIDEPGTPESKAVARAAAKRSSGNGGTEKPQALQTRKNATSGSKAVASKNRPSNQHGTRRAAKLNRDQAFVEMISPIRTYDEMTENFLSSFKESGWDEDKALVVFETIKDVIEDQLEFSKRQMFRLGSNGRVINDDFSETRFDFSNIFGIIYSSIKNNILGEKEFLSEDCVLIKSVINTGRRLVESAINDILYKEHERGKILTDG